MTEIGLVILGTVLANNFVLTKFLGLCPFFGASARLETALGMGLATTFVLTLGCGLGAAVEYGLLEPFGLTHLRVLAYILVIASVVQFTETLLRHISPMMYRVLGIYLPLITTNCAVLGAALLTVHNAHSVAGAALQGFGAALGFSLVLVSFAVLRERLDSPEVPAAWRGAPIALVTAAIMAMAFAGFVGLESGTPP